MGLKNLMFVAMVVYGVATLAIGLFGVAEAGYGDRVLLSEVKALTLREGAMTTGRRSAPIPQTRCLRNCYETPSVIQCINQGFDGRDYQWRCEADLSNKYKFGEVTVVCEGYDYPDDPYILAGSCGVEYSLELTDAGRQAQHQPKHHKPYSSWYSGGTHGYHSSSSTSYGWTIGEILVLLFLGYLVYVIFLRPTPYIASGSGSTGSHWHFPWGGHHPSGYPPGGYPGSGYPGPGCVPPRTRGPGFWAGLGLGGLMGNWWGRRPAQHFATHPVHPTYSAPTHPSGYSSPPYSPGSTPTTDPGSRTAAGYGGTRRR